ncbi:uncharacterized protein PG998_008914 [Apiospora kogelbergensis]|uniref:uncharacterized protein n=1 Tax=Apiospora kogelbergensis TaxID=1337665 RepID=UPI003131D83A
MGYYETIGVTRSGDPGFIRGISYHHHHNHRGHHHHREHRCKCFEGCCGVSLVKFNELQNEVQNCRDEKVRIVHDRDHYRTVVVELNSNYTQLNSNYTQLSEKYKQLSDTNEWHHGENARLQSDNDRLVYENDQLRRCVAGEDGQVEALKRRIKVLKRESDAKDQLYRDKSLEARELRHTIKDLDKKVGAYKERYDGAALTLRIRDRELREKEDVICKQNIEIQRLEHLLRYRRDGW